MEKKFFHHALKVLENICLGCTHCMKVCPTGAIRVSGGLAHISDNLCVDCGMCLRHCPVKAIIVEQDDFNKIFKFKYRIALIPAVLIGQFPEDVPTRLIHSILHELGFNRVAEVELGVPVLKKAIEHYFLSHPDTRPLISSFCPAIIRLIQVKFPALAPNIMLLKPPLDVTAMAIRRELAEAGAKEEEIGIFYVTPCAAKIAAIKSPVGEEYSPITGVINMDLMYNKIFRIVKGGKTDRCAVPDHQPLDKTCIEWSLSHGEAGNFGGRCLAIDEIHNVMEFLEKIENEEITNIDFLELRACDQSCAGGVLTSGNRFLTRERLLKRGETEHMENPQILTPSAIDQYEAYLLENIGIGSIQPRPMLNLGEETGQALLNMDRAGNILKCLPRLDCGACGSPSCEALAGDIAMGKAQIGQCFYVDRLLLQYGHLPAEESFQKLIQIWGENKIMEDRWKENYKRFCDQSSGKKANHINEKHKKDNNHDSQ